MSGVLPIAETRLQDAYIARPSTDPWTATLPNVLAMLADG
jgi:hypothetical protein